MSLKHTSYDRQHHLNRPAYPSGTRLRSIHSRASESLTTVLMPQSSVGNARSLDRLSTYISRKS